MKTKLLFAAAFVLLTLGFSSCEYDVYQKKTYPPQYRTYQDRDHGGQDEAHGGGNGWH